MSDYIGAHISISGGLHLSIDRALAAGCGVLQIFTRNSNQWHGKPISSADAQLFRQKREHSQLRDVVAHDSYLINLAAPPGDTREKSIEAFGEELKNCALLGIDKLVMHPGSHTTDSPENGLARVIEAFDILFEKVPEFEGQVLLETTAGQGSNLGSRFEELGTIINGSRYAQKFGVCLDTCHIFAAGYDISTYKGYIQVMEDFDRIIGIDRLRCFHFNDSKKGLGSRVDRHEHIGKGALGLEPFGFILKDNRFDTIAKVLETPKGDAGEMDGINMGALRTLISG